MPGPTHTAILLTGGLSRRMGQDKATLNYQGQPLWEHQRNTLAATHPEHLFISMSESQDLPVAREETLRDVHPQIGPLGGLDAAFQASRTPLVLVLAVDLPFMTTSFLQGLVHQADPHCGVVPVLDGYYEPLAAIYPVKLKTLTASFIQKNDYRLQDLVGAAHKEGLVTTYTVHDEERLNFRNLNRPEDLK